jgi:Plasmid pRiA4b ORF-3-like protein
MKRHQIFVLTIALTETQPRIWRRFRVRSDITLRQFHEVIGIVMGWTADEPFHFIDAAGSHHGEQFFATETDNVRKTRLRNIINCVGARLTYQSGFEESWTHEIVLESIGDSRLAGPARCVGGQRQCPPDDCGGPLGFTELLRALVNRGRATPKRGFRGWLEGPFRPLKFKASDVNEALRRLHTKDMCKRRSKKSRLPEGIVTPS